MKCFTSGAMMRSAAWLPRTSAVISTLTSVTPGKASISWVAWVCICSFTGQAGVVRLIVTLTVPSQTAFWVMKPRLTMSRPRSGSTT